MADFNFDQIESGFGARNSARPGSFLVNLAGAATSIALVLGLGYWGYKLAVRDMTGIPVVRALEGPMRISPLDPGGEIAVHQGLSVNTVAAAGGASRPADRLILAPQPIDLTADDAAGTAVAMVAPVSGRSNQTPWLSLTPLPEDDAPSDLVLSSAEAETRNPAVILALAEALAEGSTPLSGDTGLIIQTIPSVRLPQGALASSPRPMPRPGAVQRVAAAQVATTETDGSGLASGTRLVQLGAFDSQEVARNEWDRMSGKFSDLLIGKTRIIQAAQSSGRTFYRLRAEGFTDEADQRRFCSALVAEQAACIPVTVR
jgi:hypothetical protein